jgi:hypothetical protein
MNNSSDKELAAHTERSKPATPSSTSMASTTKSSGIQYFKCGGRGHVIKECPNNRTILVNDQGEYESASEEEQEAFDEGQFEDATVLTVYFGTPNMFITLWFGFDYGTNLPLGTLII